MKTIHKKIVQNQRQKPIHISFNVCVFACACALLPLLSVWQPQQEKRRKKKYTRVSIGNLSSAAFTHRNNYTNFRRIYSCYSQFTQLCVDSVLDRTLSRTKDIQIIFVGFKTIYYYSTASRLKVYRIFE